MSIPELYVVQLPRAYTGNASEFLSTFANKSKVLRLQSLQTDPGAYGSSYEVEADFPSAKWKDRLTNMSAQTFIALRLHEESQTVSAVSTLQEANDQNYTDEWFRLVAAATWVGSLVLLGPRLFDGAYPTATDSPWNFFNNAFEAAETTSSEIRRKTSQTFLYGMNAVYIDPESRGLRLGTSLIHAGFKKAKQIVRRWIAEGDKTVCVVMVEKDNQAATALYLSSGFEIIGEESYVDGRGKAGRAIGLRVNLY